MWSVKSMGESRFFKTNSSLYCLVTSLQLCSSLADGLAHWWQEGEVEVPGEPLSFSDSGSENCNCIG